MADDTSAQTFKELAKGATDVVFNSSFPILSRLLQTTGDREIETTRAVRGLEDSQQKFDETLLKVNSQLSTLSTYSYRSLGLLGDILKEFKIKNGTLFAATAGAATIAAANNLLGNAKAQQVSTDPALPAPGPMPQDEKNSKSQESNKKSTSPNDAQSPAIQAGAPPPVTAPADTNKPAGGAAGSKKDATKNTQIQSSGGDPIVERVLATIRTKESNSNYTIKNRVSSASGAYQFIDSTWASLTKKYDIGTEFKHASLAPPAIQDEVARRYVKEILQSNSNDVTKVPIVWYTGNAQGKMSQDAKDVNKGLAPATYQSSWMKVYNSLGPSDDSTKKNDATKTSAPAKVTSPGAPAQAKESGEEQAAPAAEPNATPEKKQPATNGLNKSESSTDPQGGQSPAEKVETPQATPTPPAPGPISALEPNKIPEAKNIETGEKLQQTSASLATPMPQQQQPGDSQVFAMNQQPSGQGAGNRSGAPEKLRDPTNPGNVEPEDAKSRYKDLFGIG